LFVVFLQAQRTDKVHAKVEPIFDSGAAESPSEGGIGWHVELVDAGGGAYNSMALDGFDRPHIAYNNRFNDDLMYAYKDATGWHITTVDSSGFVGGYPSLALDSNGYPLISYCSCTGSGCWYCNDLKYAWYDGTDWHTQSVATLGNVGGFNSLAIDEFGKPHISYYDESNKDLMYASKDQFGVWQPVPVDTTGDVGQYTSLKVGWDHIYISYYGNQTLKYAHYNPDALTWSIETLDSKVRSGLYSSLDLCKSYEPGAPRIGYGSDDGLEYAHKWFFGGWSFSTLDLDFPYGISFVLNPACQIHLSYYTYLGGELKYAYSGIYGWNTEVVDDQFDPATDMRSSLVLDSAIRPHISYMDDNSVHGIGLKYAYKLYNLYLPLVLR
jgi:hypothetical protein